MDVLNELLRAYKGIQKFFTPLLINDYRWFFGWSVGFTANFNANYHYLGGGAAKIDHIKEWNNDLYKLLFCLFCQKKTSLKNYVYTILDSF